MVDDEEVLRRLFTKNLQQEGFQVVGARSGHEALALLKREFPDLIVLDLDIQEMDGLEILRRLRQRAEAVKVVVLTAHGTAQRVREAVALDVREFLGKPFDLNRLLRIVAEEVEGRSVRFAR